MSSQGSNWLRVAWHGTSSWLSCHVRQISRLIIKSQDVWVSSTWFCGLECSAAASEEKSRSSVRRRPQVIQVYKGRRHFFMEEVASVHLIWLTDGWLRLTGASLAIDKGWLKECMSFAEFCHFQLITLLKQETRLDLLGRGWFAHQFQSNLARVHASKRSSNTAAPLFAQVSTLRPSSILSKVRLRASNKTSHETRERSELGVRSQTLLTLPNFISLAPLYFHTHKTFCEPHLPSDIQRCHGIPNSW